MSEEQTNVAPEVQATETPKEEVKVEETKQNTFTQEQLDNIIKTRLEAEKISMRKNFKKKKNKNKKS
jgi:hypothetical protein